MIRISLTMAAAVSSAIFATGGSVDAAVRSETDARAVVDVQVADRRGDAHRVLDILWVKVTHSAAAVKVTVKLRGYAFIDSLAPVSTEVGVHFDTNGTRRPEHLLRMEGFHGGAGSTSGWNDLNSNGMDPWGDWLDCYPDGWSKPLIKPRPAKKQIVFTAPRTCLGDPSSVRVAVQTYDLTDRPGVKPDWLRGVKRYTKPITLAPHT